MNRRLLFRSGIACAAICLLAWRLPGMLDGALSSIDEHKGTLSLLSGSGLDVTPASGAPESPTRDEVAILGAASSLTPAQRAKLLDAAKKNDPLAQAQAKIASRTPGKPGVNAPSKPAPAPSQDALGLDPSLLSALRALGMDPSALDLKTLDIDALLANAREGEPKE
jgi:hypothetical protein